MRRVLHVAPFLWSGAGNVITRLCESQHRRWDVHIVTSGTSRGLRDWSGYRRRLTAAGIAHHRIDFFRRDSDVFWRGVEQLTRLVTHFVPDVVHTHAGVPASAVAAVCENASRSFRHVNHVYSWGVGRPSWMNTMDLAGIRRADAIVCSATRYQRLLLDAGVPSAKLSYIPWGLELDRIDCAPNTRTPPAAEPIIGFVGRLEPRKGQLELIRAFARLRRRMTSARLELVGPAADTSYVAHLKREIRSLGLERSVVMTGHVADPQRYISRWDLFVSLSSDEGQGLAVLEAMANGVAVLARRVAGVEDYVQDGVTAWECLTDSPRAVADRMRDALTSHRRGDVIAEARRMIERRYDWSRTVAQIEELYGSSRDSRSQKTKIRPFRVLTTSDRPAHARLKGA